MSRVCLLTGAGGLFGNAWCTALADQYDIVAAYHSTPPRSPDQHSVLFDPMAPRRRVTESAHPVFTVQGDLSEPGEVERLVELALAHCGRIDLVVNAAADVLTMVDTTDPRSLPAWTRQLTLNALVPMQVAATVAQACWRGDESGNRTRGRNVVNVSSTAGLGQNTPTPGRAGYAASKAALNMYTRRMALDYARFGIRVNAVAPTNFPQVLTTDSVIAAVRRLDRGQMTGRLLILEHAGNRWL